MSWLVVQIYKAMGGTIKFVAVSCKYGWNGDRESFYIKHYKTHFQRFKDRGNDLAKLISTP